MAKLEVIYNNISETLGFENKRLSVVIAADSLCFFGISHGLIVYISQAEINQDNEIIPLIEQVLDFFSTDNIHVYYNHEYFTFIPRKFFLYGNEESYIRNMFDSSNHHIYFTDHIEDLKMVNVYAAKLLLDVALRQKFPGVKTEHVISKLCQNFIEQKSSYLNCYFLPKAIVFYCTMDSQLQFVKRVSYQDENDVLYYLNEIITDYGFDGKIRLMGFISVDSKIQKLLNVYIKDVELYSRRIELNSFAIV